MATFTVQIWRDGAAATMPITVGTYSRYAEAAVKFWESVQAMPDDGWAQPTSGLPGTMRRAGRDWRSADQTAPAWWVQLEVVR